MQVDAFAGYNALFDDGRIIEAACLAHARRKYFDIHQNEHRAPEMLAHQASQRISRIYAVEADIRGQPPDERCRQRQERTRPLLGEMHGLNGFAARLSERLVGRRA